MLGILKNTSVYFLNRNALSSLVCSVPKTYRQLFALIAVKLIPLNKSCIDGQCRAALFWHFEMMFHSAFVLENDCFIFFIRTVLFILTFLRVVIQIHIGPVDFVSSKCFIFNFSS